MLADKIVEVRTGSLLNICVMDKSTSSNPAVSTNPRDDLSNPLRREVVALRQQVAELTNNSKDFPTGDHKIAHEREAYNRNHWSDALSAILLGFRTAYKEDLLSSSTEVVYGTTIRLLGEFFDSSPMDSSLIQLVENLKSHFDSIRPSPASNHSKRSVFVQSALKDCSHVFIRNDTVRKPLHKLLTMDLSKSFTERIKRLMLTLIVESLNNYYRPC
ncbi:pol polyprotein [Trichonephila inaurata madagascariensis]|uniref:Pol polyprotein n=1 Tax=Trichonephila inaurata madagascariensis TaxID=2747483 RepID=A0A8X6XKH7_9ARAC|nr:pol polyprotein [Trichonephila inaurata madagascariensis]